MRKFLFALLFLFMSDISLAAIISGTIYDSSLDAATDVIVTISTEPKQVFISKNSTYSFNVPAGNYTIKAEQYRNNILAASDEDAVIVRREGSYRLDLVLFPSIAEEESLGDVSAIDEGVGIGEGERSVLALPVIVLLVFIFLLLGWIAHHMRGRIRENAEEGDSLKPYIDYIKKHRRVTQKEIRKEFPLSEGKISLIMSELEEKGTIKKIKKGRGNIIILK